MKTGYTYIMANKRNGTLYVGVTSDLIKRTYQHRNGLIEGFTKRYALHKLVYYEVHQDIQYAIAREKQMKHWSRKCKLLFIETENPDWEDLFQSLV